MRVWLNPVGGWVVGPEWLVVGLVGLKIKICTLAPLVLSPNLQLPAHELILHNSFNL